MNQLIKIIKPLAKTHLKNRADFLKRKRQLSNALKISPPLNSDLLKIYHQLLAKKQIKPNQILERFLRKREIRTLAGVAIITVLTKAYPCPGQCVFCPTQKKMPKSYLSNEPAAARALALKFDPFQQVKTRIEALQKNGHKTDKIELIVLGGSFTAYSKTYQTWFIKRCFDALNHKTSKNLAAAQKLNEKAKHRCVGLTLETRPDLLNENEIKRLRQLGATRLELGVQSIYDPILKLNQRGHNVNQTILATKLLKQAGFKITYHLMPNLPGSNPTKDLAMFKTIFLSPNFQPDQLKIYPCVVTKNTKLYRWFKDKKFVPYTDKQLKTLLIKIKKIVPPYVRISRLIRDIPQESIVAGNLITNLRQIIQNENVKKTICRCLRCRQALTPPANLAKIKFYQKQYPAAGGVEYFLSFASRDQKTVYAFLRLRFNSKSENNFIDELKNAAIIRELHTYGELMPIAENQTAVQHLGLGKKLMAKAETLAKKNGYKKMAVIAGIGVRPYYQKLGYQLSETYMIKCIKKA